MWDIAIFSYNCQNEYIKGKDNKKADILSKLSGGEGADEPQQTDSNRIDARSSSVGDNTDEVGESLPKLICRTWWKNNNRTWS